MRPASVQGAAHASDAPPRACGTRCGRAARHAGRRSSRAGVRRALQAADTARPPGRERATHPRTRVRGTLCRRATPCRYVTHHGGAPCPAQRPHAPRGRATQPGTRDAPRKRVPQPGHACRAVQACDTTAAEVCAARPASLSAPRGRSRAPRAACGRPALRACERAWAGWRGGPRRGDSPAPGCLLWPGPGTAGLAGPSPAAGSSFQRGIYTSAGPAAAKPNRAGGAGLGGRGGQGWDGDGAAGGSQAGGLGMGARG